MDKLVKENVVTKATGDSYVINKKKVSFLFLQNIFLNASIYNLFVEFVSSPCGMQLNCRISTMSLML